MSDLLGIWLKEGDFRCHIFSAPKGDLGQSQQQSVE
jgi:hypothetical protein